MDGSVEGALFAVTITHDVPRPSLDRPSLERYLSAEALQDCTKVSYSDRVSVRARSINKAAA